jgi:hypothetical protein
VCSKLLDGVIRSASIKGVRTRLGHNPARITLDVYGHVFHDEGDRTRQAVDDALDTPWWIGRFLHAMKASGCATGMDSTKANGSVEMLGHPIGGANIAAWRLEGAAGSAGRTESTSEAQDLS